MAHDTTRRRLAREHRLKRLPPNPRWLPRAGIALLAWSLCLTPAWPQRNALPALGEGERISLAAERQLGDRIARELYRDPDYLEDPVLDDYIARLWQPLVDAAAARGGGVHQRLPKPGDVVVKHRVFEVVRVAVKLARDAVAQLALGRQRNALALAQRGQRVALWPGGRQAQTPGQQRDAGTRQPARIWGQTFQAVFSGQSTTGRIMRHCRQSSANLC